jgi:hypothetical protein
MSQENQNGHPVMQNPGDTLPRNNVIFEKRPHYRISDGKKAELVNPDNYDCILPLYKKDCEPATEQEEERALAETTYGK